MGPANIYLFICVAVINIIKFIKRKRRAKGEGREACAPRLIYQHQTLSHWQFPDQSEQREKIESVNQKISHDR